MDLSKPAVVQRHNYLPICPTRACPWAKNLPNQAALGPDLAEPISQKPLDRFIPFEVLWNCLSRPVVVQHPGHLTLTLDFQGQILNMLYLRNGRADRHETKGMSVDRMLDPYCDFELWHHPWPWVDPWFSRSNFEKVVTQEWDATWNERDVSRLDVGPML